jgi:hypothetical protein
MLNNKIQAAGSYPMPGLPSGPQGQNVDFKFQKMDCAK